MTAMIQGDQLRTITMGLQVTRATAAITGVSTKGLFTVAGGAVLVTSFVGVVTTIIQAQATLTKIVATPTTGTVNDLSATVDLAGAIVGSLIGITGLAGDATVVSTGGGVSNLRNPIAVNIGTIGVNTAASSTGSIRWMMTYVPLENGASVTAV